MQKLKYYYKLFTEHIEEIWNGIKYTIIFVFLKKSLKEAIRSRIAICNACPYMSVNYTRMGLYLSKRKDDHCVLCGCNKFLKTHSLISNCGIEELNKRNNTNIPLKWTKLK